MFSSPSLRVSFVTLSPTLSTPSARPSPRSTSSTPLSARAAPCTVSAVKHLRSSAVWGCWFGAHGVHVCYESHSSRGKPSAYSHTHATRRVEWAARHDESMGSGFVFCFYSYKLMDVYHTNYYTVPYGRNGRPSHGMPRCGIIQLTPARTRALNIICLINALYLCASCCGRIASRRAWSTCLLTAVPVPTC